MKYDFTTVMDRLGKDAIAVDIPHSGQRRGIFRRCPDQGRFQHHSHVGCRYEFSPQFPRYPGQSWSAAAHPAYGYFRPTAAYYDSIIRWHEQNYGTAELTPECIGYENGVLGGVVSALRILCRPGDSVIVQAPHLYRFYSLCGR